MPSSPSTTVAAIPRRGRASSAACFVSRRSVDGSEPVSTSRSTRSAISMGKLRGRPEVGQPFAVDGSLRRRRGRPRAATSRKRATLGLTQRWTRCVSSDDSSVRETPAAHAPAKRSATASCEPPTARTLPRERRPGTGRAPDLAYEHLFGAKYSVGHGKPGARITTSYRGTGHGSAAGSPYAMPRRPKQGLGDLDFYLDLPRRSTSGLRLVRVFARRNACGKQSDKRALRRAA